MELVSKQSHDLPETIHITRQSVHHILGSPKYSSEVALKESKVGISTGMAWTSSGGELLFIEAVCTEIHRTEEGKHHRPSQTVITGNMGRVMEESCNLALSWIRSNYEFIDRL